MKAHLESRFNRVKLEFDGGKNMVEWKTETGNTGGEIFNLYLSHHYQEPKIAATLWRDIEGDWLYTCLLTNDKHEFLYENKICEHDAKIAVSDIVYEHFKSEMSYYQDIVNEFKN